LHGLPFCFQPIEALYIVFEYFSLFFLFISHFFAQHSFFLLFLLQIWLYRRLQLLHPPTISPSQYLPKYYCDRKPKNKEMDPAEFIEFLMRLSPLGVQWVVEWGCITDMVNRGCKGNCVLLAGLFRCSYYFTCRIARQFGDR